MNTLRSIALSATLAVGAAYCEVPESNSAGPVAGREGSAITGRCTQYEELLTQYAPLEGWDVARMSRYMWRESGCEPAVRSRTSDTGLLQINDINHAHLTSALGEPVDRWTLTDAVQNIRAAAELCRYWRNAGRSCYSAWF